MKMTDMDLANIAASLEQQLGVPLQSELAKNPHLPPDAPPTMGPIGDAIAIARDAGIIIYALNNILSRVNRLLEGIDTKTQTPQQVFDEVRLRLNEQYLIPARDNVEVMRVTLKVVLDSVHKRLGL
jgi:hypothetical protein